MSVTDQRQYKDPAGGTPSSIGDVQFNEHYWYKKSLIELQKEQYFQPLANTRAMPKHMGKKITQYLYLPLLDDRNVNDQGIDANGVTIVDGNLYGSSKDIGTIPGKMPTLSETGGRVNRVGFKRTQVEGSIDKYGFFSEYTKESVDFDTDAELMSHVMRETTRGANELVEDRLQIDLLNAADTKRVTSSDGLRASIAPADVVDYDDFLALNILLNDNRTPKQTTVITGTRLIDTKVIQGGRVLYCGSELEPTLRKMQDPFGNAAFIGVEHYAAGTTPLTGEIGSIGAFRIVVVPEMLKWEGAGAAGDGSSYETGGSVDVFPMLCVGEGSFTTIGFQTDGNTVKFKVKHAKPESPESYANDPYGETGFMSIKWYYGFMALRPERLALIETAATAL